MKREGREGGGVEERDAEGCRRATEVAGIHRVLEEKLYPLDNHTEAKGSI